jgi:hypothetical protein
MAKQFGGARPSRPGVHPPLPHLGLGILAGPIRVSGNHQPAQPDPQLAGSELMRLTDQPVSDPPRRRDAQAAGLRPEHVRPRHINVPGMQGRVHRRQPLDQILGQRQLPTRRPARPGHRHRDLTLGPTAPTLLIGAQNAVNALPHRMQVRQQPSLLVRHQPLPRLRQPHKILIRQRGPIHTIDDRRQTRAGRDQRQILRQPPPPLRHTFDSTQDSARSQEIR